MNIDWSKAPEGATHYAKDSRCYTTDGIQFYKLCVGRNYQYLNPQGEWVNGGLRSEVPRVSYYPLLKPEGLSQIELAKQLISLSADIRQPINPSQAAWMAAQLEELGYRKFEIIEGDV